MEESMIVGALETLNEEALEDAMEERLMNREANAVPGPSNPLSPIISDPEEPLFDEHPDVRQIANTVIKSFAFPSEIDVLFLKSSRDSPSFHVSAISLSDSITDVESSSGRAHQCPTSFESAVAGPSTRIMSDGISTPRSVTSSPVSRESRKKGSTPRPSSLVYDSSEPSNSLKNTPVSDMPTVKFRPIAGSDKTKTAVTFAVNSTKTKRVRKRSSVAKDTTSYSSSDTDETPVQETNAILPQRVASPQDGADGFYSDDEHTPLVSPFHVSTPSNYNLQAAQKSVKESTPEKSIPKQSQSENGFTKKRKPLERQFSIDSNLYNFSKPPPVSTSMVDIPNPPSPSEHHSPAHRAYFQSHLPVYVQHVSDAISPEQQTPTESDFPLLQNETIL